MGPKIKTDPAEPVQFAPARLYVTQVEGYDGVKALAFTVTAFDEGEAEIELQKKVHTRASWDQMARDIARAIDMLDLDSGA